MRIREEGLYRIKRAEREIGCGGRTRTSDHRINNPALYQLSYTTVSTGLGGGMVAEGGNPCQPANI